MSISLRASSQRGFSLVELLVGLTVGLIASGAILQTFSTYEAQKRSTVAGSEAQENGLVALSQLEQDIHNAGAGLADPGTPTDPGMFDCVPATTKTYSSTAGGPIPNFSLTPLIITPGATATDSDAIQVNTGDLLGGIPAYMQLPAMVTAADNIVVSRTNGFAIGDLIVVTGVVAGVNNCTVMQVSAVAADGTLSHDTSVGIYNPSAAYAAAWPVYAPGGTRVLNPKLISSKTYQISGGNLQLVNSTTGLPPSIQTFSLVHNIVFMKAQYGVAPSGTQSVDTWVDATGIWAPATLAASPTNRKRIKAVRFIVVSRSDKQEGQDVTSPCTNVSLLVNNGPCAWRDSAANPAPLIDLSANTNWKRYRYKVYQTIVPLRNVLWGNV